MATQNPKLARVFAYRVRKVLSSRQCKRLLRKVPPGFEHKAVAPEIERYLNAFIKGGTTEKVHQPALFDWEGRDRGKEPCDRYYEVLGSRSYPDAAVLSPFRCAFEFDREPKKSGSSFKDALMKAAVHVLSGAYEACVLAYILPARSKRPRYLARQSEFTRRLIKRFQAVGLYVTFIRKAPG